MSDLARFIEESIAFASDLRAPIPKSAMDVEGLTSPRVRHLLNALCAKPGTHYLEVGLYKGATFCSALTGNDSSVVMADGIDSFEGSASSSVPSWSEDAVRSTLDSCDVRCQVRIWPVRYKTVNPREIATPVPVNVYFYDGPHEEIEQEEHVRWIWPALADEFVMVVDDYRPEYPIPAATNRGLNSFSHQRLFERVLWAGRNGDLDQWWNCLGVFGVRKT